MISLKKYSIAFCLLITSSFALGMKTNEEQYEQFLQFNIDHRNISLLSLERMSKILRSQTPEQVRDFFAPHIQAMQTRLDATDFESLSLEDCEKLFSALNIDIAFGHDLAIQRYKEATDGFMTDIRRVALSMQGRPTWTPTLIARYQQLILSNTRLHNTMNNLPHGQLIKSMFIPLREQMTKLKAATQARIRAELQK